MVSRDLPNGIALIMRFSVEPAWRRYSEVIERVDVFFVISGFLITNIIVQDIEVGHFSFSAFYARRASSVYCLSRSH